MVIVRQTTHGAYILTEMDGAVSKLRFAAFRVIPYHARRRINLDLETFFVFPDADEETEDAEDEMRWRWMRISKRQQSWRRKYHLMMKRITHHEYRLPPRYCRQINGFQHIPAVPKKIYRASCTLLIHSVSIFRFISPFYLSVSSLCLSLALSRSSFVRDLHGFQGHEAF
jgi:hypothetical protein